MQWLTRKSRHKVAIGRHGQLSLQVLNGQVSKRADLSSTLCTPGCHGNPMSSQRYLSLHIIVLPEPLNSWLGSLNP
jgi:hypothetical protein